MDIKYTNYPDGYVNVKQLMIQQLDRPKHKSRFVSDGKQLIPIISMEVPLWD